MDEIPRLPDEHLVRARELVSEHRTRTRCRYCYDRGYQGTNQHNMLVPCSKCVDTEAVLEAWCAYVRSTPELSELYGDYFEPDSGEE